MRKVFIVAEAGVNHNGDIGISKKMIDVASKAGANAVKFQMFHTERLVCNYAVKARYQQTDNNIIESQAEMLKKLELTEESILSTGMSTVEEIDEAIKVLKKYGTRTITLLHCNSQYPTPMKDVNLKAMLVLKKMFDVDVGYSDHTVGIEVPIAAVTLGATVVEKHFTIDRNMDGPDHKASLEPDELSRMVYAIRNIERAMGKDVKLVTDSEEIL